MRENEASEKINRDRRRLLGAAAVGAAAAGAAGLFPLYATAEDTMRMRTFRVNIPEEQLVDPRRLIATTRWPDRETVTDESQGCNSRRFKRSLNIGARGTIGAKPRRN
jgi:hypothetical protein